MITIVFVAIIILICAIAVIIYLRSPSTKYNKATNLALHKKYDEAILVLEDIFYKYDLAPVKYAECLYLKGLDLKSTSMAEALKVFNNIIDLKKRLPKDVNESKFEIFEARAFYELFEFKFQNLIAEKDQQKAISGIKRNIQDLNSSKKSDIEGQFIKLLNSHYVFLQSVFYNLGINDEKSGRFIEAIKNYNYAIDYLEMSDDKTKLNHIIARKEISKTKISEIPDQKVFPNIRNTEAKLKNDFFFRYAFKLIRDKSIDEAEKILLNDLPKDHPETKKLQLIVSDIRITNAKREVEALNKRLEFLINNNYPENETKCFYSEIDEVLKRIGHILPEIKEQLESLKPSLFNRLFSKYYDQKKYSLAISLTLKYPCFFNDLTILRNLGISCFKFAFEGMLDEENYKIVIASWLTALYSDQVILDSLGFTHWDDDYTFSLYNSIGSNYILHSNLPENVNFDEPSINNISIGEAQRELSVYFERILHEKIKNTELQQGAISFYDQEKNSIEKIIEIIDEEMLFASPYFAKLFKINDCIIDFLENQYENTKDEECLLAGSLYSSGESDGIIKTYGEAKAICDKMTEAVINLNLSELQSVNIKSKLIYKFETISSKFEESIFHTYNITIKKHPDNDALIRLMEETIKIVRNNENLKYQYAHFIQELCEVKVFEKKTMQLHKGLELMIKAYQTVPDNNKICTFLVVFINNCLYDILNENTLYENEIFNILDKIKNSKSRVYKLHSPMLENQARKIISQLSPENRELILKGYNLNSSGRRLLKVLTYFQSLS